MSGYPNTPNMPVTEAEIKERPDAPRSNEAQICLAALRDEQAKWKETVQSKQGGVQRLYTLHAHLNGVEKLLNALTEQEKKNEPFVDILKGIKSLRGRLSKVSSFDLFHAQKNHLLAQFFNQLDQVLNGSVEDIPSEPASELPQAGAASITSMTERAGASVGVVLATPSPTSPASTQVIKTDPIEEEINALPEEQRSATLAQKLPEVQVLMDHLLSPKFCEWVDAMSALLEEEVILKEKAAREALVSEKYLNLEEDKSLVAWESPKLAMRSLEWIKSTLTVIKSLKEGVPLSEVKKDLDAWNSFMPGAREILREYPKKRGERMQERVARTMVEYMTYLIIHTKFLLEALPKEAPSLAAEIEEIKKRHYADYDPKATPKENAALSGLVKWKYYGNPPLYSDYSDFTWMRSVKLSGEPLKEERLTEEVKRAAPVGSILRVQMLQPTDSGMEAYAIIMPNP